MNNDKSVYIYGESGNIGSAFHRTVEDANTYEHADTPETADIIGLCVPSHVGSTLLGQATRDQLVVDFSGASKQAEIGNYGLVSSSGELWSSPNQDSNVYGNPGCMAGAVLIGLEQSGLLGYIKKSISITAVGGKKYSPAGSDGELWVARRTYDHPHVLEIERALDNYDISVASFVPIISSRTKSGLLVTVSGELKESYPRLSSTKEAVDVKSVTGSERTIHRLETFTDSSGAERFTLNVAVDNIQFVVANALRLMDIIVDQ